jgi:seryl-tRNA synthetase
VFLEAKAIVALQDALTVAWHEDRARESETASPLLTMVAEEHGTNFDLWHEEDRARDPKATDADIAQVKRTIDRINQRRNDQIEAVDDLLLRSLPPMSAGAPLHSETPGMIIDRLSILSLKIFHMREQADRTDVDDAHRAKSRERLSVLTDQRSDLQSALAQLAIELQAGTRRFKQYRQMKMYNDPTLNPAMYGRGGR